MADHLSNIFGTEKDKVNCPFYYRVGACRHGERCSRLHNTPLLSQTVLIPHMYLNPVAAPMIDAEGRPVEYDKKYLRDHFEEFYEDAFEELSKFGEIEELNVCDNVNEHLLGNVYIKYRTEEGAETAVKSLQDFEESECSRGGLCNFLHLKPVSRSLRKELFREQKKRFAKKDEKRRRWSRSRSRSRSPKRVRSPKRHKHHADSNGETENSCAVEEGSGPKLRCYACGMSGHRSAECPRRGAV